MTSRLRPSVPPGTRPSSDPDQVAAGLGARVMIDIVIPRTQTAGKMRLLSRKERFEATAEARATLAASQFPTDGTAFTALGADEQWMAELMVCVLSRAIRDPANPERSLAPIEEWREECDDDQLLALYEAYKDLEVRWDPFGAASLTEAEQSALFAAAKKKDIDLLMSFGSRKLALSLITSVDPPASSPTPKS